MSSHFFERQLPWVCIGPAWGNRAHQWPLVNWWRLEAATRLYVGNLAVLGCKCRRRIVIPYIRRRPCTLISSNGCAKSRQRSRSVVIVCRDLLFPLSACHLRLSLMVGNWNLASVGFCQLFICTLPFILLRRIHLKVIPSFHKVSG